MRFGSLFSGIGGIDLGLERAGMTCRWQVEIDDYATKVLEKHWPDVTRYRDVRTVGAELEAVDLIAGGFPCQDVSDAGRRAGIDGERSGLWSEYARIVGVVRPRYVLVENVAALLVRGMERVLGDLAALGYDAEWDCIPACAVGAPHIRDRIFIVATPSGVSNADSDALRGKRQRSRTSRAEASIAGDDGEQGAVADAHGVSLNSAPHDHDGAQSLWDDAPRCGSDVANAAGEGLSVFSGSEARSSLGRWRAACRSGWWGAEPSVGRVADGIPNRVGKLRGLGNSVVPQVVEWIGRRLLEVAP